MLNTHLHLNSHVYEKEVEKVPIRKGFGEGLLVAGQKDSRVVGLCADLTESTHMHLFKNAFPERFVEIGVAEQNLATVASGMASMGKVPFMSSYAIFSPGRNWEQIRTTICYNNVPVKIAGSHAGVSVGPDGGSHQALEDIAIMRVIPRMVVVSPCDAIEAQKATIAAATTSDPTYIRLAREKTPLITTTHTPFVIGKAEVFFDTGPIQRVHVRGTHKKVGIIATGALLYQALLAARRLAQDGYEIRVLNLSTIKPLDEHAILRLAHDMKAIVTVEEHQVVGGMGSAIAEFLSSHHPTPIEYVGVRDVFGQSGTPDELIDAYHLNSTSVVSAAHKVMLRSA